MTMSADLSAQNSNNITSVEDLVQKLNTFFAQINESFRTIFN